MANIRRELIDEAQRELICSSVCRNFQRRVCISHRCFWQCLFIYPIYGHTFLHARLLSEALFSFIPTSLLSFSSVPAATFSCDAFPHGTRCRSEWAFHFLVVMKRLYLSLYSGPSVSPSGCRSAGSFLFSIVGVTVSRMNRRMNARCKKSSSSML